MIRRFIAGAAAVALGVGILTACNPPAMQGGGWVWDPSPSQPIYIDETSGVDLGSVWKWNYAAGTTIFAIGGGNNADVDFQYQSPIYRNGDPAQGQLQMWVQLIRSGPYVSHCIIHYDPNFYWGNQQLWSANIVGHELGHCLDYPDVPAGQGGGYQGVMSYDNFTDPNWQNTYWWQGDDQVMLARDGYGP